MSGKTPGAHLVLEPLEHDLLLHPLEGDRVHPRIPPLQRRRPGVGFLHLLEVHVQLSPFCKPKKPRAHARHTAHDTQKHNGNP